MGYKEKLKNIGKKVTIKVDGLNISVKILDYKNSYGKDRWLVTPVSGWGESWVETIYLDTPPKEK